ncbi:PREDICTED: pentatricopeptide repeat-containing protein At3g23020 [Tarenaya hassleriana]|uniref:pentatricopeptide repeat-containing protein At3g23020 n=1 Tax=Tarenaya hassleriana TaxID=28532 RepID=UPI00053C580C|nr:PREDICTED: pentatricopeptide repeat-containing protein At3g23020 [Tarenaya hassleriana]
MFANLYLDGSSLQILCSTKTLPPNLGSPISPLEKSLPIRKSKQNYILRTHDGEKRHDGGNTKQGGYRNGVVVREFLVGKPGFVETRESERVGKGKGGDGFSDKGIGNGGLNWSGTVVKMHAKCSTKGLNYGGCMPAILQALDSIEDVEEALSPWAENLGNKERTIILKEQTRWERAVEIFEWFKSKDCYELNVIHYNIMLRILGKARKWKYVQNLWDEMAMKGIEPINSTYGTLIDVYSKGGLKVHALCWLGKMSKIGMHPDEVTTGIVLQMYKKARQLRNAEEFFKKWSCGRDQGTGVFTVKQNAESNAYLGAYAYNTMIDTYGKAGQIKEASDMFSRMLIEGIVPTTVTFNTLIHMYGNNGQFGEVTSLMKTMERLNCSPDTRTYNILISLHAKNNDIQRADGYFREMKDSGFKPDLVSYRTLLYAFSIRHMVEKAEELIEEMDDKGLEIDEYTQSALTRMYIEARMLEKSWLWFQRFHFAGNMSSEGYSANIDAYGERGYLSEAERAFLCCRESKNRTVLEFNVMIKAYGIGRRYEKACELFERMKSYGVQPDKCTYSSLIQILASADMPHKARPFLEKMRQTGFVSDCVPYCAVISSFVKLGRLDMAEEVYREMIRFDIKPDVVVYGVLINAFADRGDVRPALMYVGAMKKAGIPGNSIIYNSLIKLYTKVGYLKEAEEIYRMLRSSDVYSSNCMINLYSERSMVRKAEEIFESMKQRGEANEFTYGKMLCMYKRNCRFEEAIQIAKKMRELKILTDPLSYNNIIGLYAMDGRFREAVETFREMVSSGVNPDESTFKSLGMILIKLGISKKSVCKIEAERKMDGRRGLEVWISTLYSVVGIDDNHEEDEVF